MRVAFAGKGGSGKTTLASLFIRRLRNRATPALVIDSDVNGHLNQAAGIPVPRKLIGREFPTIAQYLEGNRAELPALDLKAIPELGTIPPGEGSRFIRIDETDEFLATFAERSGSIWSLTVGGHEESDIGDSCFHTKLNSTELIVHRLLDRPTDWLISDTTAGVDNVGTSLVSGYDLFVYVVEPTAKSVGVVKDFREITKDLSFPVRVLVVPNKVRSQADLDYICGELGEVAGQYLPMSRTLRKLEQIDDSGETSALISQVLAEAEPVLAEIEKRAQQTVRDWTQYHRTVAELYRLRCEGWWNEFSGLPLDRLISPSFRYPVELAGAAS